MASFIFHLNYGLLLFSYLGVVYLLYMLYFKMSCVYCGELSCVYCCHLMCICCTMCVLLFLL